MKGLAVRCHIKFDGALFNKIRYNLLINTVAFYEILIKVYSYQYRLFDRSKIYIFV